MKNEIAELCDSLKVTLQNKNTDYGQSALLPSLLVNVDAGDSILVRMGDKIRRIQQLKQKNGTHYVAETLNETVFDLAGYCILYLISQKQTPNIEDEKTRSFFDSFKRQKEDGRIIYEPITKLEGGAE